MKANVHHVKRLSPSQFNGTRGSDIHSRMTMNRVMLNMEMLDGSYAEMDEIAKQWLRVTDRLAETCRDYYFIADKVKHDEFRVYFLSREEMEEFIVWAKLALPLQAVD